MDHLGVEVPTTDEVAAATARLADAGLATRVEDNTTCCYAVQDKVWVTGPGGEPWEVYTVTGDARPDLEGETGAELSAVAGDGTCCRPEGSATDARARRVLLLSATVCADRAVPGPRNCASAHTVGSLASCRPVDLDEVADELYAVPPEEFIALRTARQDEAKADGDKALAKEIGALPKPSAAAWACNLLVREHREEIEGLVELGDLLREAQENLAGDQLRALDVQRRQLLTALTRQAAGAGPRARAPGEHRGRHPGRGDAARGDGRPRGGRGAAHRPAHLADVLQRHGDDGRPARPPARAPRRSPSAPAAAPRDAREGAPPEADGGVGRRPPRPRAGGAPAGGRGEAPARAGARPGRRPRTPTAAAEEARPPPTSSGGEAEELAARRAELQDAGGGAGRPAGRGRAGGRRRRRRAQARAAPAAPPPSGGRRGGRRARPGGGARRPAAADDD